VYNGGMEIIKEITVWDCEYNVPNNTYLLNNKGKLIAYIKDGDSIINQLKTPLEFSKSRRKFIKIQHDGLSKLIKEEKKDNTKRIIPKNVQLFNVNSNDRDYTVEVTDNRYFSCTCIGFGYRNKCKHVEAVKESL
jgi:predicted metal-dependent RNase